MQTSNRFFCFPNTKSFKYFFLTLYTLPPLPITFHLRTTVLKVQTLSLTFKALQDLTPTEPTLLLTSFARLHPNCILIGISPNLTRCFMPLGLSMFFLHRMPFTFVDLFLRRSVQMLTSLNLSMTNPECYSSLRLPLARKRAALITHHYHCLVT